MTLWTHFIFRALNKTSNGRRPEAANEHHWAVEALRFPFMQANGVTACGINVAAESTMSVKNVEILPLLVNRERYGTASLCGFTSFFSRHPYLGGAN